MLGFGITPEGINQNYVMYEFALERGWDQTPVDTHKWMDHYVHSRYGAEVNQEARTAWDHLRVRINLRRNLLMGTYKIKINSLAQTSVYSFAGNSAIRGKYVICRRPGTKYPINVNITASILTPSNKIPSYRFGTTTLRLTKPGRTSCPPLPHRPNHPR